MASSVSDTQREYVTGGKGRRDEVGKSGIYPASSPDAPGDAVLRGEGELVGHTSPRTHEPAAKAELLIRRPAGEVFEAFVDPALTSKFWFTRGSGRLEPGKRVTWEWDMFGLAVQVRVKALEPEKRLVIEWAAEGAVATTVEWLFTSRADRTTVVSRTNYGFVVEPDDVVKQAIAATEGFTLVLAGLKALLEHNVVLNLVADRPPDGLES